MAHFVKVVALATAFGQSVNCLQLDVSSSASIKQAAATVAYDLTSLYSGNSTNTTDYNVGLFPRPLYWWESGAVWGAFLDYYAYTGDSSYNPTVTQALLAQTGPDDNYMPPAQTKTLGNDDQAFWALACIDAVEFGFPNAPGQPQWLDLATNVWNTQVQRWDDGTCNGGLRWQIFSFNAGYDYKNALSNVEFFQLSARLARITGNTTYVQWADKTWDWLHAVGIVNEYGAVYDGTDTTTNCSSLNHIQWSDNAAGLLFGAATMYNQTNGSAAWRDRVSTITNKTLATFVRGVEVLSEVACEPTGTCNTDQRAFKGIAARWLAKTTAMAPFTRYQIRSAIVGSAQAAAGVCTGGSTGTECGFNWLANGYDNMTGVGPEANALSVIQALLLVDGKVQPFRSNQSTVSPNGTATVGGNSTSNTTGPTTSTPATYQGAGVLQASTGLWSVVVASAFVILGQGLLAV